MEFECFLWIYGICVFFTKYGIFKLSVGFVKNILGWFKRILNLIECDGTFLFEVELVELNCLDSN